MIGQGLVLDDGPSKRRVRRKTLSIPEEKLIEGLQNKDRGAMSALYQMYSDSLYKVISTIVVIDEVAQDLLQETFIRIWRSFSLYDPRKGRLYTWMARLAKNISIDYLRSSNYRYHAVNEDLADHTRQVDETFQINFNPEVIGVKDMTRILNSEQQTVLDLIYFKGYTHVQAAEELNITLGILRSRLHSSISVLRKNFT